MKRLPLFSSLVVLAAVVTMMALGVWQLQRKAEKEAALATYAEARSLPAVSWPSVASRHSAVLFRRSALDCRRVNGWRAQSGRNLRGDSGWVHLADCSTPTEPATLVVGWSTRPDAPRWNGGSVAGVIGPDRERGIRLIAGRAPAGLQPAQPPSLDDVPNNHLFYALQWFFFALAAAVIYVLALRRRTG